MAYLWVGEINIMNLNNFARNQITRLKVWKKTAILSNFHKDFCNCYSQIYFYLLRDSFTPATIHNTAVITLYWGGGNTASWRLSFSEIVTCTVFKNTVILRTLEFLSFNDYVYPWFKAPAFSSRRGSWTSQHILHLF